MDVSTITQLVSSVGFPIAVSLILMYYIKYTNDQHKDEIDKLAESINNNTTIMQKLVDKLDKSEV